MTLRAAKFYTAIVSEASPTFLLTPPPLLPSGSPPPSLRVLPEMKEISVMNNYFGLGLDAQITYKFNTTREKNPAQYK